MGLKLGYGALVQVDYQNGVGKVQIEDTEILSDWATLPKNLNTNIYYPINAQAVVIYDIDKEYFEILNIVPFSNEEDKMLPPSWASENVEGVKFSDGSYVTYDSKSKVLTINATSSQLKINCKEMIVSGNVTCKGDVKANNVKANIQVTAGVTKLTTHIHGVPNGVTTIPQ